MFAILFDLIYPVVGDDACHGNAPDLDRSVDAGTGCDERLIWGDVDARHGSQMTA